MINLAKSDKLEVYLLILTTAIILTHRLFFHGWGMSCNEGWEWKRRKTETETQSQRQAQRNGETAQER